MKQIGLRDSRAVLLSVELFEAFGRGDSCFFKRVDDSRQQGFVEPLVVNPKQIMMDERSTQIEDL